jgi:hypothetical protein
MRFPFAAPLALGEPILAYFGRVPLAAQHNFAAYSSAKIQQDSLPILPCGQHDIAFLAVPLALSLRNDSFFGKDCGVFGTNPR